jgi:hypothetical protein
MKTFLTLLFALVFATGVLIGALLYRAYTTPYCPTEDSCTANHYEGQYHIEEDAS